MNRDESARIAKLAWAGFPHCVLDEFAIESFHVALSDIPFAEAFEATKRCLRLEDRTHPPSHGEIIGAVRRARRDQIRLAPHVDNLPAKDPEAAKSKVEKFWAENPRLRQMFQA